MRSPAADAATRVGRMQHSRRPRTAGGHGGAVTTAGAGLEVSPARPVRRSLQFAGTASIRRDSARRSAWPPARAPR